MLRLLRPRDLAAAFELSVQAGWNQTEDDWRMLLELAPASCWAIEIDGVLAATTTLVCYERRLAWIGMVLTKKQFQHRGLASRLFQEALRRADEIGVETIKLDATEQGRPLYEKFGFRAERKIQRCGRSGVGAMEAHALTCRADLSPELDRLHFGADRSKLLTCLASRNCPLIESRSYLFARAGKVSAYLGPCVSDDPKLAQKLISQCVDKTKCAWVWDLFPDNNEAVKIAQDLGFAPQRHLTRMSRGKELREDVNAIYAIAGFELG
jgi:GNAT superfamily N-acetyltransferase